MATIDNILPVRKQLERLFFVDFIKEDNPVDIKSIYISDVDIPFKRIGYYVDYSTDQKTKLNDKLLMDMIAKLLTSGYYPIFIDEQST